MKKRASKPTVSSARAKKRGGAVDDIEEIERSPTPPPQQVAEQRQAKLPSQQAQPPQAQQRMVPAPIKAPLQIRLPDLTSIDIVQKEFDSLVKEITAGVKRTIGDVTDAERVTEINNILVNFVTNVMQVITKLLQYMDTYNKNVTTMTKQLSVFKTQLQTDKTSSNITKPKNKVQEQAGEFSKLISTAMNDLKKYLRPEDMIGVDAAQKRLLANTDKIFS